MIVAQQFAKFNDILGALHQIFNACQSYMYTVYHYHTVVHKHARILTHHDHFTEQFGDIHKNAL